MLHRSVLHRLKTCLAVVFLPVFLFAQGSPNVTLLKQLDSYSAGYNDCWGYIAPDGREYALLGVKSGTSIVDITDAANAQEVAFISSSFSSWKDIKTYQNYAYTVTETDNNLQIIDLSNLPVSASLVATYNLGFATDPHNIYIDEAAGILYGADDFNTNHGVHILSLLDPLNPVELTSLGPDAHDMYAQNGKLFIAEGTSPTIGIYDVSSPANPTFLQRITIPAAGYVHNVWPTADNNYIMSTEETNGKTVKLWDVSDLNNPVLTDTYLGPNNLAHNAHIKGNYAYISHYESGLRIVDISDPNNIFEAGFYDTPDAWGAWPFFASGKILISDISGGLYVVFFEGAVEERSISSTLSSGWNLVGLPVQPADSSVTVLFPNATPNTLFSYNGSYVNASSLQAGKGYWINMPAAETVTIAGQSIDNLAIGLQSGWNLISDISCPIALNNISDPNNIIVPGTFFGFNGAYVSVDSLKPGNAYWVNTNAAGQITLDCASVDVPKTSQRIAKSEFLENFPKLTLSEAATGNQQDLYFNVNLPEELDIHQFSLPPTPPAGVFDARFNNDSQISENAESEILLQSKQFPITIIPGNLGPDFSQQIVLNEITGNEVVASHRLETAHPIVLQNPRVHKLRLSISDAIPETFSVFQNYPNPFNPETVINYQLSITTEVTLTVFDMLGRKVRTLLKGQQVAGSYEITWDGRDASGKPVASGVYLYRVSAGDLQITKRMILLR